MTDWSPGSIDYLYWRRDSDWMRAAESRSARRPSFSGEAVSRGVLGRSTKGS